MYYKDNKIVEPRILTSL